jgi:NAD(P)-dependent dehydrogenase (short-subunit alcohol dehydrogenase family)
MARQAGDPLDLTGRVVLVTGGTRGIGQAIAARFEAAGADVAVCARHAPVAADRTGGTFFECDVRDPDAVGTTIDAVVGRLGRLDVVVNNAGGSPPADAADASPRLSEKVIALNLLAPLHVSQAANRVMQLQEGGGSIVNIASVSGVRPSPGTAAYGAAKAGLLNLTQTLAVEWAPKVRVNAVVAGLVLTEESAMYYGDDQAVARIASTIPMARFAEPDDIADACLFLASPLARYVTGAALAVHGGGEPPPYLAARESP